MDGDLRAWPDGPGCAGYNRQHRHRDGQLFCAFASGPAAGTVVAVVNAADKSAVTGKAEDVVAAACPIVNGIKGFPVSPPANPATVPVVAATAPAS